MDPRETAGGRDPMEWHRHRVHPLLWRALEEAPPDPGARPSVARRELERWRARLEEHLARRPAWSQTGATPPWEEE